MPEPISARPTDTHPGRRSDRGRSGGLSYRYLRPAARIYVAGVILVGTALALTFLPTDIDRPALSAIILVFACVSSTWKVNLPAPLTSGSTLSVSYAADLMALLLLGPRQAMVIAMGGVLAQCTIKAKRRYPTYRTLFSIAAEGITMRATSVVYFWMDGVPAPTAFADLPKPLVGMIATYYLINTGLVAGAIALSTGQRVWTVWRDNFLWTGPSFVVAGGAGALAAVLIHRGDVWLAPLMAAPIYLTYRTYKLFLGRIDDAQARAAQTEQLAVILRSIGDGVIATDIHGTVTLLNAPGEMMTGWTHAEAIGKPLAEVFHNLDYDTRARLDASVASVIAASRMLTTRRTVLVARDGSERPIDEVAAPLRDGHGRTTGTVIAFRDVTEAIRSQEERARASRLTSIGILAGGIAHDFNNIMTAVLGNISLARATLGTGSSADGALADAERASDRARQLTKQLLTFAKGGAPVKRTVQLKRLVAEATALGLSGSNAGHTLEIDPDLWPVDADEGQLIQLFQNLVLNALQAMPEGGVVTIRGENLFEPEPRWEGGVLVKPGRYVGISVNDHGTGISTENLPRIFEPYFTTKPGGAGLGLATSHSIVARHGGYITVNSQVGRGTAIRVCLPASFATVEEHLGPAEVAHSGKGRVLVLDDEEPIRTLATGMLNLLGYDAVAASTGNSTVEQYAAARKEGRPFDIVILDLTVPGSAGGKDVLQKLRRIDPTVNAIVFSGYAEDPVMARYRDYGFKAVLPKPFTVQELSRALHEVAHAPS